MSTCPDPSLFSAYADGEVPSPWKEKLEAHLSSCAECSKRVSRYKAFSSIIAADGAELSPERLDSGLEQLQRRIQSKRSAESGRTGRFDVRKSGSIRIPVHTLAAMLAAAVFIPSFIIQKTTDVLEKRHELALALNAELNNQYLQKTSLNIIDPALPVYSPDLPQKTIESKIASGSGQSLFTLVNYARQFATDKTLFSDAEIIIIKLPNLTKFGTLSAEPELTDDSFLRNTGYYK